MDFSQSRGNLADYSVEDLLYYFSQRYKIAHRVMGSELNAMMSSYVSDDKMAELDSCNFDPMDIVKYCKKNKPVAPTLTSPNLLDVLFMKGETVTIRPMPTATAVIANVELTPKQISIITTNGPTTVRDELYKTGVDKLQVSVRPEVEAPITLSASLKDVPSVVVRGDDRTLALPLMKGELLVPPKLVEAAKRVYEVDPLTGEETVILQRIVDQIKYTKNNFVTKTYDSFKYVKVPQEALQQVDLLAIRLQKLFGRQFRARKIVSASGRDLMVRLAEVMLISREEKGYKDFVLEQYEAAQKVYELEVSPKIGGYPEGTLKYSEEVLKGTRGIRGGDDKENTAAGLGTYLPVNVRRGMVKILARAADIMNLAHHSGMTNVQLVGDDAGTYLDALIYTNAQLDCVCAPIGDRPGWTQVDEKTSKHDSVGFTVVDCFDDDDSYLYVDTNYREGAVKLGAYAQQAVLTDWPVDIESNLKFMPSVLLHNLKGFRTNFDCDISYRVNLFSLSVKINIARTYSWFMCGARAYDVIHDLGGPELDLRDLKKFFSQVTKVEKMSKFVLKGNGVPDLQAMFYDFVASEEDFASDLAAMQASVQTKIAKKQPDKLLVPVAVDKPKGLQYDAADFDDYS